MNDGNTAWISLLTDFGLQDEYVGVMKAVIAGLLPDARVIDISHQVPPQDVEKAAWLLEAACFFFPPQTVHVVVVDPGVGSRRSIIAMEAGGQRFLAPDNGVLGAVIRTCGPDTCRAVEVTCEQLWRRPVSATFHGRDIFAPVAARWAGGMPMDRLGTPLAIERLALLPQPAVRVIEGSRIQGRVVDIDRFGNLITDITSDHVEQIARGANEVLTICVGKRQVGTLAACYSQVPPGRPLGLIGSRRRLEVAVNQGNAAQLLSATRGTMVTVQKGRADEVKNP